MSDDNPSSNPEQAPSSTPSELPPPRNSEPPVAAYSQPPPPAPDAPPPSVRRGQSLGRSLTALGVASVPEGLRTSRSLRRDWPALLEISQGRMSKHGDFSRWWDRIETLGPAEPGAPTLTVPAPRVALPPGRIVKFAELFEKLGSWKKGPFRFESHRSAEAAGSNQGGWEEGFTLDAEWRSDLKWSRLEDAGINFKGKSVLDVGTGNGYFLYRLAGAGASFALGLEPSLHYVAQFLALQRAFATPRVGMLPITGEEFVRNCACFDQVMSLGVLYHRRSPLDHLVELRSFLRSGGQLILETIVVEGDEGHTLLPKERYAQMRNVFFLPSVATLTTWLARVGFTDIVTHDVSLTTSAEQRTTNWTGQPSLDDFLAPSDGNPDAPERLTREGLPRPRRALLTCTAP